MRKFSFKTWIYIYVVEASSPLCNSIANDRSNFRRKTSLSPSVFEELENFKKVKLIFNSSEVGLFNVSLFFHILPSTRHLRRVYILLAAFHSSPRLSFIRSNRQVDACRWYRLIYISFLFITNNFSVHGNANVSTFFQYFQFFTFRFRYDDFTFWDIWWDINFL